MTVDMEKYEKLLQQFGGISHNHISQEELEKLKEKYRSDINSKRVFKNIVDINCLLNVLKKRGVLQYNNLKVLWDITNEYVRDESTKKQIKSLIDDYNQWLKNSSPVNFFYNSGKSNTLLTSHEYNVPKTLPNASEAVYLHNNFDDNLQTSTEDATKESLLANESLINLNTVQNEKDTDKNSFFMINFKKCPLNISRRNCTTVLIFLILTFILIGIVCILIKLPRESTAVVPENSSSQAASGQSQLNMPFYMSSTYATAGFSTQATFSVHHTQAYTTSTVPPVDRERELKILVVNGLSKKVGHSWVDVCRTLDLNENTLDEITIEFSKEPSGNKFERMFKKGMTIYFSEPHPRWRAELRASLSLLRRKDLLEKYEQILEDHPNL